MFNKKNKKKGEDEIMKQRREDFEKKMIFIKTRFFPALIKATTSIDDALQNLTIINSVIMDKFLGQMKEKTVKDLNLEANLSVSDPKHNELKELLELFDEMTVFQAKEYFEGMKAEINLFLNEEQKERTLDTLKVKWIDELK